MADLSSMQQQLALLFKNSSDGYSEQLDRQNKLEALAKQLQGEKDLKSFEGQQKADLQQKNIKQAQDIVSENAKAGRKVNAKIGDVDVSQSDENPLKYLTGQAKRESDATSKAYMLYNQGLTKLKPGVDASKEGLDALSDPKQTGSLGIVRSNMLRSMGMNRYNDQEASKSMPPALLQYARTLFTGATSGWDGQNVKSGDDNNPMTPQQKAAAESFFRGHIANAQAQHEVLKNQARGYLRASGHYNPTTQTTLEDGLSHSGFDEYTKSILAPKEGTPPSNYASPPPGAGQQAPPQQPPQQEKRGFWGSLFGGGSKPASPSMSGQDPLSAAIQAEKQRRQQGQ